jgi:hypothetical protein
MAPVTARGSSPSDMRQPGVCGRYFYQDDYCRYSTHKRRPHTPSVLFSGSYLRGLGKEFFFLGTVEDAPSTKIKMLNVAPGGLIEPLK